MSRNYQMKDLTRARGYSIISHEQGLNSFLVGLHCQPGNLLVGLDGSKQYIQRYREMEVYSYPSYFRPSHLYTGKTLCQGAGRKIAGLFGKG